MAPKDPVTAPAFPGAEVHSAPVKDVSSSPIIPIASEPVKDASTKGVVDAKKGKTEPKKKVSSSAKVDVVNSTTEVKVAEVASVQAKVEPPCLVKEVSVPSAAKVEVKVPEAPPVIASIPNLKSTEVSAKVEPPCLVKEVFVPSAPKVEVKVHEAPPVIASIPNLKSTEVSAPCVQPAPVPEAVDDDEVVIVKETISKKFGEMTFSDYNSAEDGDFSLSDVDTEDSLEWASETERTRAEDDLAEDKVGIDYVGAAFDIATEQAASFRIVQAGLAIGDWVLGTVENITSGEVAPLLSSVRRSARKMRRAGERESGPFRPLGMVSESTMTIATALLSTPLALLGWQFKPVAQAKAKKVWMEDELCEEPCTFEELDLSDYDSDLDADYTPSEESSEDELEFCTDAEGSSGTEDSDSV